MKIKRFFKRYVPTWVTVVGIITLASLMLYFIAIASRPVADFVNSTVATAWRVAMALLSYIFPFSLFELIIVLAIPTVVLVTVLVVRARGGARAKIRRLFAILGVVGIVYSGYLVVMAIPYRTTPLNEHLGIEDKKDISKDELYITTLAVRDEVNSLADKVVREGGESRMNCTLTEMSAKLVSAYDTVRERYPFFSNVISRAKPIMASGLMCDMGLTGIYTYYTGEANVNTEYPDYSLTFVTAHEFAHQRGINRENEANFMAFLVTTASDDPFLRYSGYLYMYQYLSSALYSADKELYKEVRAGLDERAIEDIRASNAVTLAHSDSPLRDVTEKINNAYLQSNGTPGTVSYGYVVRLAVAYYNQE